MTYLQALYCVCCLLTGCYFCFFCCGKCLPKDLPEDFDHPDVGDLQDGDGDEEVSRNKIMVVIWLETKYGFLSAHGARGMKTSRDIRSYFLKSNA